MNSVDLKNTISLNDLEKFLSKLPIKITLLKKKNISINKISDGRHPIANSICFIEHPNAVSPKADVVYITPFEISNADYCIIVEDPRYVFIKILDNILKTGNFYYLDKKHDGGTVDSSAQIHPEAIIEDEVIIENDVYIGAGAIIKKGTIIKENSIIRENTVIGCPGISLYRSKNNELLRFPHLSGVVIGENVEIGANSVVAQGTLMPTLIENNVVIGNLCNIGHGVQIKSNVWISVGTLVGGNTLLEKGTTIGLGVSIKDRLILSENSSIGMGSVVVKSTKENHSYFGNPAKPFGKLSTGPIR